MSIFNKIKNLFQEEEAPKQSKTEVISQHELPNRVESLLKSSGSKNQALKQKIKERISRFDRELSASIELLQKNDLSKRKEYEKIKLTVLQNRDTYVSCINKLIKDINKLDESNNVTQINRILLAINDFGKASLMPYEKATYLIGKEMAATRDIIKQFAKDISDFGEQNKPLFDETAVIEQTSSLFEELKHEGSFEEQINREIMRLSLKAKSLDDEKDAAKEEISKIKNSQEHKEDLQMKEVQRKEQEKLKKEMEKLKQRIDFKALARVFHHDKRKAELIKAYSSNFVKALKEDEGLSMISLVHESQSADIFDLKELREQLIHSESQLNLETERKISALEEKLRDIDAEKAKTAASMEEESKKLERQKAKKKKTLSDLSDNLKKLNIEIKS